MQYTKPINKIIRARFSCRTYADRRIEENDLNRLVDFTRKCTTGPFGTKSRFEVAAASEGDSESLKGLGTYGFINNAPGFIIGASKESGKSLEDFGYLKEMIILYATDLGLGTCWLGGTFTRSKFAEKISAADTEIIPAVTAVGYVGSKPRKIDNRIRKSAGSDHRLPWEYLFYDVINGAPLLQENTGEYLEVLEMVRLGPSASNKQPWRIIKDGILWHFYLLRTPGYRDNPYSAKMKIVDLQRVDMGIAMCHFELTANEKGLNGSWKVTDPNIVPPVKEMEYLVSWVSA
jgi:hypothetical protein